MYTGMRRGGVSGYGGAALSGARLYGNVSGNSVPGLGPAGNIFGIYNGIKQGGISGYGGAAVNAAQMASAAGYGSAAGGAVGAVGAAALPVALFAAQKMIFDKQSSWTPGQQYKFALGKLNDPKMPEAAKGVYQFVVDQWNPKTGTFKQTNAHAGYSGSMPMSRYQL